MPTSLATSHVLFVTEMEQFGGAERSLIALSAWLHRHGLPHYVLTYIDHCNLAQYADHPLQIVELKPGFGARSKIASLKQHFKTHSTTAPKPLLSGYQSALHGTLAGLRYFHTLMHDTPSLFSNSEDRSLPAKLRLAVSNRIAAIGLRGGGQTIVTSEYLRSECLHDFGVQASIVRMGGLNVSLQPQIRPVDAELRMLSVCRIEANKRIDWLLRALAQLEAAPTPLSSRVNWHLDLAGKGSQIPSLSEMAVSLGIAHRVHFHGFVPDDALEELYRQAHLFLMPAVQGYGIPAIESLQRGIPVLLHRDSGVSDILTETPWAKVFEGKEENLFPALNEAIDKVIAGTHHAISLPELPTEDQWAEKVAALCGWL